MPAMPTRYWDEVDRTVLDACASGPVSLVGIIAATGYPGDVVKDLLLGYARAGHVARTRNRHWYRLTALGHARLAHLTNPAQAAA